MLVEPLLPAPVKMLPVVEVAATLLTRLQPAPRAVFRPVTREPFWVLRPWLSWKRLKAADPDRDHRPWLQARDCPADSALER